MLFRSYLNPKNTPHSTANADAIAINGANILLNSSFNVFEKSLKLGPAAKILFVTKFNLNIEKSPFLLVFYLYNSANAVIFS